MSGTQVHDDPELLAEALLSRPVSRSVEATSALLKRWYVVERETMRTMAGWLPAVASQDLKLLLARHAYMNSLVANDLRERILQLRYPRRDVDRDWETGLCGYLASVRNAPDESALAEGLCHGALRPMERAYTAARRTSDAVGDSATRLLIERALVVKRIQAAELRAIAPDEGPWAGYIAARRRAAGGISGAQPAAPVATDSALEVGFRRPSAARRDSRYARRCELTTHHGIWWNPAAPGIRWLSLALVHFNELWAAEAASALLYEYPDAPWELQMEAARWMYDESRHFQMGLVRLQRSGLDVFADVPAPDAITYDCFEPDHLRERLLAIHCFEHGGVTSGSKQAGMDWHGAVGDAQGSMHYDFDWADESIHLSYGLHWLKHLYGEEILDSRFRERLDAAVNLRSKVFRSMAARERPRVEAEFRHMCGRLGVPFEVTHVA